MEREELFQKRIDELAEKAYARGIVMFTDFLDLYELNMIQSKSRKGSGISVSFSGGYEYAERQMAAFVPDALCYNWEYPFSYLEIRPQAPKFAEKLNHRDYLGSVMGLGIERSKIGDFLVKEDSCILIIQDSLKEYVCRELTSVRHTLVDVSELPTELVPSLKPQLQEVTGSVASVRLDSAISLAFNCSRSSVLSIIESGNVTVNARVITTNAYHLKEGDLISVRGKGKFRCGMVLTKTKKGRNMLQVFKYI